MKLNAKILLSSFILLAILPFQAFSGEKSGIERAGDIGQYVVPIAALGVTFSNGDYVGSCQMFNTSLATMSTAYGLKAMLNAKRPDGGRLSFPSGHTASAFMGATFLHHRYGFRCAVSAYAAATFVGFSRVHSRRHYTYDVLGSVAIAYGASWYFTTSYCPRVEVVPVVEKDFCGICIDTSL